MHLSLSCGDSIGVEHPILTHSLLQVRLHTIEMLAIDATIIDGMGNMDALGIQLPHEGRWPALAYERPERLYRRSRPGEKD
ncbi:MAG: hypothetical protein AAGA73_18895 [Pseudomonadota bacterium]